MSTTDSEGPAWNKFWLSLENETESLMSGEGASSRPAHTPDARSLMSPELVRPNVERGDSVMPHESASHNGGDSPEHSAIAGAVSPSMEEPPFAFKFKAPSGRMHRLQFVASAGVSELVAQVAEKLGGEVTSIGGMPTVEEGKLLKSGFALSYLDNEGDTVSITTDRDLVEAVSLARQSHRDKVDLFVHHPDKPPISATLDPHPALAKLPTPPQSAIRERRRHADDGQEDEGQSEPHKDWKQASGLTTKPGEQLIAGVPNELLLPGAIVTLAVVIIGVFALGRSSSR